MTPACAIFLPTHLVEAARDRVRIGFPDALAVVVPVTLPSTPWGLGLLLLSAGQG